jgi:hypothetical protein
VGLGLAMTAVSAPGMTADGAGPPAARLSSSQRKRIKQWLKRCRMNPRHSQLNLEGYLLLPVQRIPRYRLLVSQGQLVLFLVGYLCLSNGVIVGRAHQVYTTHWRLRRGPARSCSKRNRIIGE